MSLTARRNKAYRCRFGTRKALAVLALWLLCVGAAGAVEVPVAEDLAASADPRRPLVLVFTASYCGYCERLESEVLEPMLLTEGYRTRLVMRKVVIDDGRRLTGFDGEPVYSRELAQRYDVDFTPTVLIVGPEGRELAERIVGLLTLDFYGAYLDRAIAQGERALAERARGTRSGF